MAQIEIMEVKEFFSVFEERKKKSWKGIKKNYKAANVFVILTKRKGVRYVKSERTKRKKILFVSFILPKFLEGLNKIIIFMSKCRINVLIKDLVLCKLYVIICNYILNMKWVIIIRNNISDRISFEMRLHHSITVTSKKFHLILLSFIRFGFSFFRSCYFISVFVCLLFRDEVNRKRTEGKRKI
jgi:hypothetical protein